MNLIGFGEYAHATARYVRTGRHLLNMANAELEKV
jgi:hypothetical protein